MQLAGREHSFHFERDNRYNIIVIWLVGFGSGSF